ncbi:MAG: hypothetical protein AB1801_08535, partial [Chloroflexota bacterium]
MPDIAKDIFEKAVGQTRFNMNQLSQNLASVNLKFYQHYPSMLTTKLDKRTADHTFKGMLRAIFLAEIVKTRGGATKFITRWDEFLNRSDPRYASYDECLQILQQTGDYLEEALSSQANQELLQLFQANSRLPYEIPIDYRERKIYSQIHQAGNIYWFFGDLPRRVVRLRQLLGNSRVNPYASLFKAVYEKIKVKTYLTDRAQTGEHQTNREKRWEVHPGSVQFSFRRNCLEIEYTLINQVCHFDGFPNDLRGVLEDNDVLQPLETPVRCPITMEVLSFETFKEEILNPIHGAATFQVGHLNPLKADNDSEKIGHSAKN